ncbi:Y-family DNA polymerase [Williamsoniiplasma lucivorax]|uniref:DNA polymerase IV n=1 Tax=Williamsoniiplasma lucivorax TaxID=209274 RepID=A0A2S5RCT7_9MOLU|nr:DNA polymerase IV [Williamsoniiplasma lucivorax]PPE05149.1 DNA polymerase IV [Williamsoniiplasma lucivorax]
MSKKEKVIFLIDMDAFFASVAVLKNPAFAHKPLVIANNHNKAIISAASYEARAYGIKAAMPLNMAKQLYKNLIVTQLDYQFIETISQRIWELVKTKFTNLVEVVSIDEAYVDVTQIWKKYGSVKKLALQIQQTIKRELDLSCSIGVSYNKFLAKMASDLDKPYGVTIMRAEDIPTKLWNLPIGQMHGVGVATEEILTNYFQVTKIGDLIHINPLEIEKQLGKYGLVLSNHATGFGADEIDLKRNLSKSISNERTLYQPTSDIEEIEATIRQLTHAITIKLNEENLQAKTMGVILKYRWENDQKVAFDKRIHLKHKRKQTTLSYLTDNYETICTHILECFDNLYQNGKSVALIGVFVSNLHPSYHYKQLDLEDLQNEFIAPHHPEVDQVIQEINFKLKKKKMFYASNLKKSKTND